ncbi:dihydrofolate reductase [Catalinimonas alkaloidigena]|uniref:dihydrofolate reductase family protein n=1 Tax=Catalinimonas alkaloidigena TaxID=1075417 RepID=UPI00240643C8|nr:dihydrofolate reductase family protein [Catalinimonas alkaloidigena]MDF9798700.1 dihydrofolate reductase [Catalinimonas alkaloidigena]
MRKLKLQMQISLDGFVAGPNGEMDWIAWNWDAALNEYVDKITASVDCILLGRKLAEGFIPSWESRLADAESADDAARKFVHTPKIVFSKTVQKMEGKNTQVEHGDLVSVVKHLKNQEGQDIIAYGGSSFVSSLIREDLIDEYHLFINPTAIGKGMSIFGSLEQKRNLQSSHVRAFECGIVALCYSPIR